jgi:hypothetical protein
MSEKLGKPSIKGENHFKNKIRAKTTRTTTATTRK